MYWYVLVCTGVNWRPVVGSWGCYSLLVCTGMYWYVLVLTGEHPPLRRRPVGSPARCPTPGSSSQRLWSTQVHLLYTHPPRRERTGPPRRERTGVLPPPGEREDWGPPPGEREDRGPAPPRRGRGLRSPPRRERGPGPTCFPGDVFSAEVLGVGPDSEGHRWSDHTAENQRNHRG